jgi:phosphoglycolate phosphatase
VIPIDAFIFDLDGTLIDSSADIAHSVNAALRAAGRSSQPIEVVSRHVGDGLEKLLQRSFETSDPETIGAAILAFRAHYREHCLDHTRPFPGVIETLDHFDDKALAVVSNKPESFARQIIEGLTLDGRIPVVLGADSAGRLKPDPAPVLAALERLGVGPARAVMVGDGLTDILAGQRAGLRTCAVTYGLGDIEVLAGARPDHLLHRFSELQELFA